MKRDFIEMALGEQRADKNRMIALKECLTNLDAEWGSKPQRIEMSDPREVASVQATVSILLAAIQGPPGAPETHDLPEPGPGSPDDENIEF